MYICLHGWMLISNVTESGKTDISISSPELDFYELSDMKLDDQEGGNTSLVCERGQDGTWEPRAEKKLRKTRHQARKTVRPMAMCA